MSLNGIGNTKLDAASGNNISLEDNRNHNEMKTLVDALNRKNLQSPMLRKKSDDYLEDNFESYCASNNFMPHGSKSKSKRNIKSIDAKNNGPLNVMDNQNHKNNYMKILGQVIMGSKDTSQKNNVDENHDVNMISNNANDSTLNSFENNTLSSTMMSSNIESNNLENSLNFNGSLKLKSILAIQDTMYNNDNDVSHDICYNNDSSQDQNSNSNDVQNMNNQQDRPMVLANSTQLGLFETNKTEHSTDGKYDNIENKSLSESKKNGKCDWRIVGEPRKSERSAKNKTYDIPKIDVTSPAEGSLIAS